MNKHLISILHAVAAGVVSGLITHWITDERTPTAPTIHYYFTVVSTQPQAAVLWIDVEQPVDQTWSF